MIVEVETVSHRSDPSDYIDAYPIREAKIEYDANEYAYKEKRQYVKTDRLDVLIDHIGTDCIVQDPTDSIRNMDDAAWVVRIYDGYNE
jgi:hypothetical protein